MKYFGTDGIRGIVDQTLDFNLAFKVGISLGNIINKNGLSKRVIIGKDTRVSGDYLVSAISSGLVSMGVDVLQLGIVPTGVVSYLCTKLDIGFGVMITASHNTADMNGIKVINNRGYKLSDDEEKEVEDNIDNPQLEAVFLKGKILNGREYLDKYITHVLRTAPNLNGVKIAVDASNGANYHLAPTIYRMLGAQVIEVNCTDNGQFINDNCGSEHPQELVQEVVKHKCDIGFAFDGDADRLVVVLNSGKLLNGDELIYLIAKQMLDSDSLNSLTVVGTIMTNIGCEESLNKLGIKLVRVDVGDKNVIEKMKINNFSLGGESSGHICIHNFNTTCDALINSLQLLKIINNKFNDLETMLLPFKRYESVMKNVKVTKEFRQGYNQNIEFKTELENVIKKQKDVRIVVRPSGTESVLRLFVEGKNSIKIQDALGALEKLVSKYIVE